MHEHLLLDLRLRIELDGLDCRRVGGDRPLSATNILLSSDHPDTCVGERSCTYQHTPIEKFLDRLWSYAGTVSDRTKPLYASTMLGHGSGRGVSQHGHSSMAIHIKLLSHVDVGQLLGLAY